MTKEKEKEFFAVATTGRRGVVEMTEKLGPDIIEFAAQNIKENGNAWIQRAIISISNNDKLMQAAQTKSGLFSIYKSLLKAATMGIQLGGQFPQAYMTAFGDNVELIPTREGFQQVAVHGPGSVLSDFEICRVYDGEDVKINPRTGEVEHTIDTSMQRGKLKGVYGIITRKDGSKRAEYMTRDEALKIRDNHSRSFSGDKNSPWKTDEDAMIEKTAAKKFLRPYAAQSEGLAMLFTDDSDYEEQPEMNVSTRSERTLEKAIKKAEKTVSKEPEYQEIHETKSEEPEEEIQELF